MPMFTSICRPRSEFITSLTELISLTEPTRRRPRQRKDHANTRFRTPLKKVTRRVSEGFWASVFAGFVPR